MWFWIVISLGEETGVRERLRAGLYLPTACVLLHGSASLNFIFIQQTYLRGPHCTRLYVPEVGIQRRMRPTPREGRETQTCSECIHTALFKESLQLCDLWRWNHICSGLGKARKPSWRRWPRTSILKDELEEFKWDKQAEETAGGYGWSGGCKVGKAEGSRARSWCPWTRG